MKRILNFSLFSLGVAAGLWMCLALSSCSPSYERTEGPVNRATKGVISGVRSVGTGAIDATGYVAGGIAEGTERAVMGSPGMVSRGIDKGFDTTSNTVDSVLDTTTKDPVSDDARARLSGGINCSTARSDIAVLEEERASTLKRIGNGVGSVLPIGAAVRVLSGNYRDGVKVASGQYNQDLEDRIAEIKAICGLS